MKTVNAATLALINTGVFYSANLYQITLFGGGTPLRYTDAPFNISDGVSTWGGTRTIMVRDLTGKAHWKTGLDTDSWQCEFVPRAPEAGVFQDFIGDVPWLEAVQNGALDNADIEIFRAFFAAPPTPPVPFSGAPLVGAALSIFAGVACEVDTTHMVASVTIRDYRYLLSTQVPRHIFQAGCRHTLFDIGCSLTAASFATAGVVGAGSTRNVIVPDPVIPNPVGSGTYRLGRIAMSSGDNDTFQRTISNWDGTLTLVNPLPYTPEVGDAFTVYPGCDKSLATCALFANAVNFGGQPYIPAAETAV